MNPYSNRKSPRASWHRYGDGVYFLTVVTQKRKHYLGEINDQIITYSIIGLKLIDFIKSFESYHPSVHVIEYVVMPNHFHLLIGINQPCNNASNRDIAKLNQIDSHETSEDFFAQISAANGEVSKLIRGIKSLTTRFAHFHKLEYTF